MESARAPIVKRNAEVTPSNIIKYPHPDPLSTEKDPKTDHQRERRTQLPLPDKRRAKEGEKRSENEPKNERGKISVDMPVTNEDTTIPTADKNMQQHQSRTNV